MVLNEEHQLEVGGGSLFAQCWTPQNECFTPIILLHDSLGCSALWRNFPEQLARMTRRRVISYDRLGFGRSTAHPGIILPSFIESESTGDFKAVCDYFNLTQFVVLGHSVGGGMAIGCAVNYPQQCEALISISSQAYIDPNILAGIRKSEKIFENDDHYRRLEKYHGNKTSWVLRAWIETWHSEAFQGWSLGTSLPLVRCPLLCLHGDADEYGSIDHPKFLVKLAGAESTLQVLDGCGHFPHRESPERVLELIYNFLK